MPYHNVKASALGIEKESFGGHEADDDHEVGAGRRPRHIVDRSLFQARQALIRAVRGLLDRRQKMIMPQSQLTVQVLIIKI